tara:strand:- start:1205 stop:1603 length:399 start_codon:yes stop_codon:yes gene_type:complete
MADAVTSQTLQDGTKTAVLKFTNISDGSGESAVAKVDVSALVVSAIGAACTRVTINKIWYAIDGMTVQMFFNASTNVFILELAGTTDTLDFSTFGGISNNAGSGVNGDILFTTVGHTNLDTYSIIMEVTKHY